jgi:hypothetical protein
MATTTAPLRIATNDTEITTKTRTISDIVSEILEWLKDSRGFIPWPDLVEQFQIQLGLESRIEAAQYIRCDLINRGKIFPVPCALTAAVVFSKDRSITVLDLYATAADNERIRMQSGYNDAGAFSMHPYTSKKRHRRHQNGRPTKKEQEEIFEK